MKSVLPSGLVCSVTLLMVACVAPPPRSSSFGRVSDRPPPSGSAPSTASASPGRARAAAAEQGLPPPDGEILYQRHERDALGSSTYTSRTQVRGPVVEERYIGNQPVDPYQPVYRPQYYNEGGYFNQGAPGAGYVPNGTTSVYDPTTGRRIPVRRR